MHILVVRMMKRNNIERNSGTTHLRIGRIETEMGIIHDLERILDDVQMYY